MFVQSGKTDLSFQDYILFVPCISVGNVGQLTADLLISTLNLRKKGFLYDDSVLPLVGNNPYDSSARKCEIATAVEVYADEQKQIAAVQQRAPCVKGKRKQYMNKLIEWIQTCGFKQVVVLTSSFAHERRDVQLQGSQLRFLLSPDLDSVHKVLSEELSWIELEKRALLPGVEEEYNDSRVDGGHLEDYFIPGSGMARQLFCGCIEKGIPVMLVLSFCEEGDNCEDAVQMATYLNTHYKWLNSQDIPDFLPSHLRHNWKIPSSWRLQYGSRFEQILYQ